MTKYLKALSLAFLLLLYSAVSLCILALPQAPARKRGILSRNTSFFARRALRILGVHVTSRRITWNGIRRRKRTYLVLSNHVSYIDILVLASRMPSIFITSIELRNTFPLGLFARFGGSIFVERRSPAGLRREIEWIAAVLGQGISVVLFPEGTTSNGDTVRPFKSALLTAAIDTGTDLLPVCLRYRLIDDRPLDSRNRDAVYYHGGISFFSHVPRFLSLRSVSVEHLMHRPLPSNRNRKDLAARAHQIISAAYHGKLPLSRRL
ncbi:MAG: 1-acyl-sn-glycerol-3-phosphate acyltransferase [Nitrospirota bacterium]|nr:1-acyl-sn-glycerol-3-phosphate acyltransferase [Nitrospirota bacterium]